MKKNRPDLHEKFAADTPTDEGGGEPALPEHVNPREKKPRPANYQTSRLVRRRR